MEGGLGENDPEVLAFHADDAVLWGTLSPTVRADRAALRDYFVTAFKVLPGLKVSFGDQLIRVYRTTAVNTGYYTFSFVQNGKPKTLPANTQEIHRQLGGKSFHFDAGRLHDRPHLAISVGRCPNQPLARSSSRRGASDEPSSLAFSYQLRALATSALMPQKPSLASTIGS
jgi:hypothetical protein